MALTQSPLRLVGSTGRKVRSLGSIEKLSPANVSATVALVVQGTVYCETPS